jgi:glycosyltransferase involved in cell wall biosynthesis
MKVLIVNNMAPFVWGGAEELAAHLQTNLIAQGHDAEVLRIPFQWEPARRIPSQMLLVRGLELQNVDRVIGLKFPAYLIAHPEKTLWLLHQYRQAYDLFDAGQTNLPPPPDGDELRALIKSADGETFAESRRLFTNSEVTRQRLKKYNNFDAEVLLPPVNDPERFTDAPAENYIFAGGRVNSMKRQHLLIEALALANKAVKLIIGGPPDEAGYAATLQRLVAKLRLTDRVRLDLRFLPREAYADYVRRASAVAYIPFDEDSLGYVAMEAATAGKPLLTTSDSGGVLGLAKDGVTGWVTESDATALAAAFNAIFDNAQRARSMGLEARELWSSWNVNWPETIERLLR